MADDRRYSWLDDEAAERLLRGEPAWGRSSTPEPDEPDDSSTLRVSSESSRSGQSSRSGSQSRREAERLAAVLGAMAEASRPVPADGTADGHRPLPGEEAAVAAFRAVLAERAVETGRSGQVGRAVRERFGADGGSESRRVFRTARPSSGSGASDGQARLRRPLHVGLVAALVGCALSGFAVATASGVLPFGTHDGSPGPRVSMSADKTADGESADPRFSPGGRPSPPEGGSADSDASDGGSYGPGGSETSPGRGDQGAGGDEADEDTHDDQGKHDDASGPGSNGADGGGWSLTVCRQYVGAVNGGAALDAKDLHKLAKAAGGVAAIEGYCADVIDHGGDNKGVPHSDNDNGSGNGNGAGNGGGDDHGQGGGSGETGHGGDSGGGNSGGDPGKGDGGTGTDGAPLPPLLSDLVNLDVMPSTDGPTGIAHAASGIADGLTGIADGTTRIADGLTGTADGTTGTSGDATDGAADDASPPVQ